MKTLSYVLSYVAAMAVGMAGTMFATSMMPVREYRVTVAFAPNPGPAPAPSPGPTPPPPAPTPEPTTPTLTAKFWAIATFDVTRIAALPPGQQEIYLGLFTGAKVHDLGGIYLKYNIADPSVQATRWMRDARKLDVPTTLVLVNEDGSVFSAIPLPADVDGLITAIKAARGRR
jgi:hypothetical protein